MDTKIKDTYRFFAYGYDKDLRHNLQTGIIFDIMFGISINSFVINDDIGLSKFLEKYWK